MKGFPFNFPFIALNSVGCVIVPDSGYTYPIPASGLMDMEFDEDERVHVSACCEEWWEGLLPSERDIVNEIYRNEILKGNDYGEFIDPAGGHGLHSHV